MAQTQYSHTFDNGLVLLAERMDWLESAAFAVLIPSGYSHDPDDHLGLSNFLCEMLQRGCGDRTSRQFVEDLDRLGVDRSVSLSANHASFGGATLASNICDTLSIYGDLILRPHLPAEQLEDARMVCYQELLATEDDLAAKAIQALRERHYGQPWGRSAQGDEAGLQRTTIEDIRNQYQQTFRPDGAIISVAGKIEWNSLLDHVSSLFADWDNTPVPHVNESPPLGGYSHIPYDSSQTQIAIAYDSVPYRHEDYFKARGAVGVLSDGMSSRLFTRIREELGLCYTVYASSHSLRDRGSVIAYSGTSTERAQETLDELINELRRIGDGIEEAELTRLKARVKSTLIMQQESSASRAGSIAGDWYHLGRIRALDEIGSIIDGLTCETVNTYLDENRPQRFTVVTLGEKELEVPIDVS
ncbi:MAG: insulinase family protein [Planctomycetales bacterium]|nr:insulinase family protein [Planctomycetales bacterium]